MPRFTVTAAAPSTPPRSLILGTAVLLALVVWLAPKMPVASAQESKAPAGQSVAPIPPAPPIPEISPPAPPALPPKEGKSISAKGVTISIDSRSPAELAKAAPGESSATDKDTPEISTGERTVTVKKGGKTITVTGIPNDEEIDSAIEMGRMEPVLGVMIVAIVAVVFLSPVIAIALILGYRMRKARMLNETMLKFAEKGIVPPADLLQAAGGAKVVAPATTLPVYDQARQASARTVWSDLRKGVVMGAIGLAITVYTMRDDLSPNILGLVLLFVGIGYVVLWWFEQRQFAPPRRDPGHQGGPGDAP